MQALLIGAIVVVLDRLSKLFVLKNLLPGESLPVIKNVFHITYVFNRGFAFGLFSRQPPFFIWICYFIVLAACLFFLLKKRLFLAKKSTRIFSVLILSGAMGNLIDRIRFGYVVDFLDFRIWPVFNIADSAITIGTILLIVQVLRHKT